MLLILKCFLSSMLKIINIFILIRLRKFFGKVDFASYLVVLAGSFFAIRILSQYVVKYEYYFLFFSLEILRYHTQRKDLDLIQLKKNYKLILFLEYSIYSFIFTIPLLISFKWIPIVLYHILILLYINFHTKIKLNYIFKYPFKLLDPFWVISFRKNKLVLIIIPVLFFIYVGNKYDNHNLILFTYLLISIVLSIPSFQREDLYFIKVSQHQDYLKSQLKGSFYNSLFLIVPIFFTTLIFGKFKLLWILALVPIPMFLNILLKYAFFKQIIQHQFLFVIILSGTQYFLPFLAIPFIFQRSRKKLNSIKINEFKY